MAGVHLHILVLPAAFEKTDCADHELKISSCKETLEQYDNMLSSAV